MTESNGEPPDEYPPDHVISAPMMEAVGNPEVPPGGSISDVCPRDTCGHFDVDTVEVAPVPLPAAGLLLLGGLAVAGVVRRAAQRKKP